MAAENSFDIACKVDMAEVANAVNQARREIETRYDLKGSKNEILEEKMDLVLTSADDMKLKAVLDILQSKLHRRGIDLKALTIKDPEAAAELDRAAPHDDLERPEDLEVHLHPAHLLGLRNHLSGPHP